MHACKTVNNKSHVYVWRIYANINGLKQFSNNPQFPGECGFTYKSVSFNKQNISRIDTQYCNYV